MPRRTNRSAAALGFAATLLGSAAASAGTETGAAAAALVAEAERTLASIERASGTFELRAPGGLARGAFLLDRTAGRLRVDIGPPLGHLMIADGPVVLLQTDSGTTVRTATAETPLAALFDPSIDLDRDFVIEQVDTRGSRVSIALAEQADADSRVLLRFERKPAWRLIGWGLFTPEGYSNGRILAFEDDPDVDPARFDPPSDSAPSFAGD